MFKESSTTKVRPVFGASCRGKNFLYLKDCLEKDPNLLEKIRSVFLRFRKEKICVRHKKGVSSHTDIQARLLIPQIPMVG